MAFDGNISASTIGDLLAYCQEKDIDSKHPFALFLLNQDLTPSSLPAFFEPTSNAKALRLLEALESSNPRPTLAAAFPPPSVSYASPNIHELAALYQHVQLSENPIYASGMWFDSINVSADLLASRLPAWVVQEGLVQMAVPLLQIIGTLVIKSGSRGILVVQRVTGADAVTAWKALPRAKGTVVAASSALAGEAVVIRHYPALLLLEGEVGTVTGAGDSLAGAMLAAIVRGLSPAFPDQLDRIVEIGQR